MTFPNGTLDFTVEMFVNGNWIDITTDVHDGDGVTISQGSSNEASRPESCKAGFKLDDAPGNYSPANPVGAYYGSFDQNTPLRIAKDLGADAFGRAVSNGWGSADIGGAYISSGLGGVVAASDFNVAAGVGTQSVPAVNAYRRSRLEDVPHKDVDVAVTVTLPFTDVTGGSLEIANILLRGQSTNEQYMVRFNITTAEAVTVNSFYIDAGGATTTLGSDVTITGLTHTSAQAIRVRVQAEGQTLRAKAWAASGAEPYGWHTAAHTQHISKAGYVGIRSGVATANTNALPVVFSYDNLIIRSMRFAGEFSSIKEQFVESDKVVYARVNAQGILRRLGQGASPVQSTLRRGITSLAIPAVAYWPGEDGAGSTSVASAVTGVGAMYVAGPTQFAKHDEIPASRPLPTVGPASWVGSIPSYAGTGSVQLRFLAHIPAATVADDEVIVDVYTDGDTSSGELKWEVKYRTSGALSLEVWKSTLVFDSGAVAFDIDGKNVLISLELQQNGANVDWTLKTLEVGQSLGFTTSGTVNARTISRATRSTVAPYASLGDSAIGHVNVRKEITNLFDLAGELNAHREESAIDRLIRLCAQNGIPFSYVDDPAVASTLMGPQRPLTLRALLDECADADMGSLHEPRGEMGISYREPPYNQAVVLDLDYAQGHIAPPFEPTRDDQLIRNDVTVTRVGGSSARSVLETGRMSVLEPKDGGRGRYDHSIELNVFSDDQLLASAGWLRHLGTVDETRYPAVRVDIANAQMINAGKAVAVLQVGVDDRFTISNPLARHSPDQISQLARGYTEVLRNFHHYLDFNAAPASPYEVLAFGGTEPFWLDTAGSTLNSGVTNSATSLSVATPSGPLWTTIGAELPVKIRVGGEVMTVTAISGGASPQTFTVARSTNGVVKAHSAGAVVALARQAVLAR